MFTYSFSKSQLQAIVALSESKTKAKALYGQIKPELGAWFVGDHGVYFMSNAEDVSRDERVIAYAKEADPNGSDPDWYDNKRAGYGGDDGADFISMETMKHWIETTNGDECVLRSSPQGEMEFMV